MKKIFVSIWNLIKIALGVCLVVSSFYYGTQFLSTNMRTEGADYNDSFHNLPENSMDILVLGSSHAQYSFVPSFVQQDTGLYSYVLGSACQPLPVSYEMLKEALKTQSPELVVLEVYTATPLRSWCEGDSCYVLAEYQMRGQERQNVIGMLPEEKAETYRNDFLINHNNWKNADGLNGILTTIDRDYIDSCFGYVNLEADLPQDNWWYSGYYSEDVDVELDESDLISLNNIYALCHENNMELMLYMMPMENIDQMNQSYRHKVWEWANEKDVKYIDFVDRAEELDYRLCIHNDGAHSKLNGASFVTDYMCEFIMDNYSFDHHKDNEMLDNKYREYNSGYTLSALRTEANPHKYLRRLINFPGTVVVRYSGEQYYFDEKANKYMNRMGIIGTVDPYTPMFAIIKNGEVLVQSSDDLLYKIDGKEIYVNKYGIYVDGECVDSENYLSFLVFGKDYDSKVVKRPVFGSYLWDYHYDYDYNYVN